MKTNVLIFALSLFVNLCYGQKRNELINVAIPEAYELANIILAITPYTLDANSFEVAKETKYYNEILSYFMKYSKHPLIEKVNFTIEKWDYYLSFRTDAYAFDINGNKLERMFKFRAQNDRNEFEDNIVLVEDFMKVSGFRDFYKNHKSYYDSIIDVYSKTQMLPEILSFLKKEFPSKNNSQKFSFSIIASPLVNRMNCHRDVNGIPTDFISLPNFILYGDLSSKPSDKDISQGVHMLFTETDHGFVNPATINFGNKVKKSFNVVFWDKNSGYGDYAYGVFNEYMTWAVYDIFVFNYFPQVADEVCDKWAKQNETRGFIYSSIFSKKIIELYKSKKKNETIRDLYPKILQWCAEFQKGENK